MESEGFMSFGGRVRRVVGRALAEHPLIVALVIIIVFVSGLSALGYVFRSTRPVIQGALFGHVVEVEGDCMPGPGAGGCYSHFVATTVVVREPTAPWATEPSPVMAMGRSGFDGYYSIDLPPGNYSVFAEDAGTETCSLAIDTTLCPVTIVDLPVQLDLVIDHAVR